MINTSCDKCVFARPVDSKNGVCDFGIIDQIKNTKQLEIRNNFYYIKDYSCKYGFSSDISEKYQNDIDGLNLRDYVLSQNTLRYYLIIEHQNSSDIKDMCAHINALEIKPAFVSIILYATDLQHILRDITANINPDIQWKTHNFLDSNTSFGNSIKVALDTKHNLFSIPYLWFNSSKHLAYTIECNAIQKINYIVNIQQPVCNFITSRQTESIYDLFINTQAYYNLTKHYKCSIDKVIDQIPTTSIYYD